MLNGKTHPSAEPPPDHDFHSGWGCTYSSRGTLRDPQTLSTWQQYAANPPAVERQYHNLLGEYTTLFQQFFSYYPISFHAHATDCLFPTTIASLILNTVATSPLVSNDPKLAPSKDEAPEETGARIREFALNFLGWNEKHIVAPNFVAIDGTYGAGFGPLAHASKEWEIQAIAAGPRPVSVNLKNGITFDELDAKLAAAKASGCIGVVVDMVSTEDGSVLLPSTYTMLKEVCARNSLLVILDETMTAIRCGAPFAFQRPEYNVPSPQPYNGNTTTPAQIFQPDLVVFGKGLGISGIGISFNGSITASMAYTETPDILQTILYWRALVSRPMRLPVLIEALGILRTAVTEDWPARSITIGDTIREIINELEPSTREVDAVRGLGSMIAVNREVAMKFKIMSAIRRRSPWVRWLPKLDRGSADKELLMGNVFGGKRVHRAVLAKEAEEKGTMPLWCFVCGIQATREEWCRKCFLGFCTNEVCEEEFKGHVCVGA